jgi:signal peptidase II
VKTVYRIGAIAMLALVCVVLDQLTKILARELLMESPPVVLLSNALRFQYAENPGAFMSLGANWPGPVRSLMFVVINGLMLPLMVVYSARSAEVSRWQLAGIALIVGGGVGNLIDRLLNDGVVIDFINIGVGSWRTGIFNVADMAVIAGVLLMLVFTARSQQPEETAVLVG